MPRTHMDKLKEKYEKESQCESTSSLSTSALQTEQRDYVHIAADFLADVVEGKREPESPAITTQIKCCDLLLKAWEQINPQAGTAGVTVIFEGENEILP